MKRLLTAFLALCLILGMLPITALALNDTEPNDTLGQAQAFTPGDVIDGLISVKGDYDWYKFTLSESGRISLTMKAYMRYYTLDIHDENGTNLWYVDRKEWNSNVGYRTDTYTVDLTAGTYYLRVTGDRYVGSSDRSTGNYTLNTSFTNANVTEKENNNSVANANPITLNGTICGQIAVNDRDDYHRFTLSESGRISLTMKAYLQYYTLDIYDENGTNLWYVDRKEWNSSVGYRTDTYTVDLTAGTYYLRVTGDRYVGSSDRSTGNYTLNTSFTNANVTEKEDNNSVANANPVALNGTICGQIAVNDRDDYHRFILPVSGRISLTMAAYMQYYTLDIYDENGTSLWYVDRKEWNSNVGYRTDTYTVDLTAGTYYLRVTGDRYVGSSDRSTGNYTLNTSFTNANVTEKEDNNSIAEANHATLNVPLHGQIAVNDRQDFYRIEVKQAMGLEIEMFSMMQYYTLHIYDVDGNTVWYDDRNEWNANAGYRFDFYSVYLNEGTYYIQVTGDWTLGSSSRSTGIYELLFNTPNPFTDVEYGGFYYNPVLWALENGITNGTTDTTFNPNGQCLRAHVVTFLHRAAKNPAPSSTKNPFTDVKATDFFYKPVLWAVEQKITNGISADKFGSYDVCNRAAVVTFLWRAAGSPEPESTDNPFKDVKTSDFFYKPVLWAVENGITNGLTATEFGPNAACNRAQVVTFLYRAYND